MIDFRIVRSLNAFHTHLVYTAIVKNLTTLMFCATPVLHKTVVSLVLWDRQ